MTKKVTYKTSGVDIKKADLFVKSIKKLTRTTQTEKFGSLFSFDKKGYRKPVLVSSADGVGTKLMIANQANKHDTVGIDLVAMNVNDILCVGAKPLFFLDYIACGKLRPMVLHKVVKGIVAGCRQAGCALIGGETAEMPGIYKKNDYDLAGFAVGVVEKSRIIDGSKIKAGDRLIGLASSGLHSNGFSLVRKVLSSAEQKKMAQELLKPTRIYVKPVLSLLKKVRVKGIAHVTGGAFLEKVPKVVPKGLRLHIYKGTWPIPGIFKLIQKKGNIDDREMFKTFNMGIGMVLYVNPKDVSTVKAILTRCKVKSWVIGEVVKKC